jgi:AcrR family transcriptional regulator
VPTNPATPPPGHQSQREAQKQRTRIALVEAARSLIQSGRDVTMPTIALQAGVSDATAYRHFPDLLAVLREGFVGVWPDVSAAYPDLMESTDPLERIGMATAFLANNVLQIQGAVRAMIALTITRPEETVGARPAHRHDLINKALEPLDGLTPERLAQLETELSIVISAESLFTLLDLRQLNPDGAVANLVRTAQTLVRAALADSHTGEASKP